MAAQSGKVVVGSAVIRFTDAKNKIDQQTQVVFAAPLDGRTNSPQWDDASPAPSEALAGDPPPPAAAKEWPRDFASWLASTQTLEVYRCALLDATSSAGESQNGFRARIAVQLREERDRQVDALRAKYAPKVAALEDRVRRADAFKQKQQEQSTGAKINTVLQVGSAILGAFLGGRKVTPTKIVTASRAATHAYTESQDVDRADQNVEVLQQQLKDLNDQLAGEIQTLQAAHDPAAEQIDTLTIRPAKTAIVVKAMAVRTA